MDRDKMTVLLALMVAESHRIGVVQLKRQIGPTLEAAMVITNEIANTVEAAEKASEAALKKEADDRFAAAAAAKAAPIVPPAPSAPVVPEAAPPPSNG